MWLAYFFSVDQDVIQIYYDKDVKFFNEDFIDIVLKTSQSVGEPKKHNLIFEVAVPSIKSSLLFVVFSNSYLEVSISQVQPSKLLGPT